MELNPLRLLSLLAPVPVVGRLAPRDAQMYWLGRRLHNDQYLLYAFAGGDAEPAELRAFIAERTARIADLQLRIHDVPSHLDYPYWVRREFTDDQVLVHTLADRSWAGVQEALGELLEVPLDARITPWRLHVFRAVRGAPNCGDERALVAVLQVSHALADGVWSTALARAIFGPADPPDLPMRVWPVPAAALLALGIAQLPWRFGAGLVSGVQTYRAEQELDRATAAGELPAPYPAQEPTVVNVDPGPTRSVRMVVVPAAGLRKPGVTVTVAVLDAISAALSRYLEAATGVRPERLGAEVTVSRPYDPTNPARNNFGNVGVELYPDEPDSDRRAEAIGTSLAKLRERMVNPLFVRAKQVTSVLPAPAMWRDVRSLPLHTPPPTVAGNTVVSSVFRGADDLEFGGGRVRFTAGFPALSPAMALTHGVHGIGDTVTVSIITSTAVTDLDRYAELLSEQLRAAASVDSGKVSGPEFQ
ncbi:WS/DGAT domain-containing protein [Aldersonia sp. NBC_00410]|uniref:wax ester/triacylglycerol synthase domain-containing protein n=1 Tax=Aldersonia sp. NBC_00410 TaxID=2975954 RepID=UPI002254AA81|nr:wax ester/triacylglycerol synthase domain-containing protein [Aldersonia sp. NBC_00410]MCX5043814.1 WS/DGAT domain-containing protein [Aldersonia sp. NBC_00410]